MELRIPKVYFPWHFPKPSSLLFGLPTLLLGARACCSRAHLHLNTVANDLASLPSREDVSPLSGPLPLPRTVVAGLCSHGDPQGANGVPLTGPRRPSAVPGGGSLPPQVEVDRGSVFPFFLRRGCYKNAREERRVKYYQYC